MIKLDLIFISEQNIISLGNASLDTKQGKTRDNSKKATVYVFKRHFKLCVNTPM